MVSGVDESAVRTRDVGSLVVELAQLKARSVAEQVNGTALVLGCDSMLELDGEALGKPGSALAAHARWLEMRGRTGRLFTGHCLIDTGTAGEVSTAVETKVHFADVTDDEIDAYCATGEPTAVAGGFTIDGFGGWFVEGVEGDPHNVVGVSLPVVRALLRQLGHGLGDIGYPARQ